MPRGRLTQSPVEVPENPSHMSQRFFHPQSVSAQLSSPRGRALAYPRGLRPGVRAARRNQSILRPRRSFRNRTVYCVAADRAHRLVGNASSTTHLPQNIAIARSALLAPSRSSFGISGRIRCPVLHGPKMLRLSRGLGLLVWDREEALDKGNLDQLANS